MVLVSGSEKLKKITIMLNFFADNIGFEKES